MFQVIKLELVVTPEILSWYILFIFYLDFVSYTGKLQPGYPSLSYFQRQKHDAEG